MSTRFSNEWLQCLGSVLFVVVSSCSSNDGVAGLEGGQTGSAGCDVSPKCICDSVAEAVIFRGVIRITGDAEASVEVLEVFGAGSTPKVGENVSGAYQVGFPCGLGNLEPINDGQEVLVGYHPPESATFGMAMYIVEWEDVLSLTPKFTLPALEAGTLADANECVERFPDREVVCENNF